MSSNPMLANQKYKFVLFEDSAKYCGRKVFKSFIKAFSQETHNIWLINYDNPADKLYSDLNIASHQFLILNGYADPLNWKGTGLNLLSLNVLQSICETNKNKDRGILCIDSLTPLYLHNGINQVYRCLHSLLQIENLQLVALLHGDVLSSSDCNLLKSISSITYSLMSDNTMLCFENHSHAKLSQCYMEYIIEDDFNMKCRPILPVSKAKGGDSTQPDPTAHLTFNLKLKNDEKEDRDKLQLPYIKLDDELDSIAGNFLCEDLYEDDPDDDLDF